MGLEDRSLSSAKQDPTEQTSITRDLTLVEEQVKKEQSTSTCQKGQSTVTGVPASGEEQGKIEQSTVTGDPALGEEQGQIEQSTVTGDPALGEEQVQTEQSTVTVMVKSPPPLPKPRRIPEPVQKEIPEPKIGRIPEVGRMKLVAPKPRRILSHKRALQAVKALAITVGVLLLAVIVSVVFLLKRNTKGRNTYVNIY